MSVLIGGKRYSSCAYIREITVNTDLDFKVIGSLFHKVTVLKKLSESNFILTNAIRIQ